MDCKKALTEAGGDFDKAIEVLRKRGQKVSASRADRATTEGTVWVKTNKEHSHGVIVSVSCETDFVAKNEDFRQLGEMIVDAAFTHRPETVEALKQLTVGGLTIQDRLSEWIGRMGEKLEISAYTSLQEDIVVPYTHMGGKLGVLVGLKGGRTEERVMTAGRDIAMQIAAMSPIAVRREDVDPATVERELAIAKEQTKSTGKPEAILEKIAQGKLNKFFQENVLLQQTFVKDNSLTVQQYLQGISPTLTVNSFQRVTVAG